MPFREIMTAKESATECWREPPPESASEADILKLYFALLQYDAEILEAAFSALLPYDAMIPTRLIASIILIHWRLIVKLFQM